MELQNHMHKSATTGDKEIFSKVITFQIKAAVTAGNRGAMILWQFYHHNSTLKVLFNSCIQIPSSDISIAVFTTNQLPIQTGCESLRIILKLRTAYCVKVKSNCLFIWNKCPSNEKFWQAGLIISKINFSEFEYHKLTEGDNQMNKLNKSIQNFQEYLKIFSSGIEKGAHLTRLAVQEPLGRWCERKN